MADQIPQLADEPELDPLPPSAKLVFLVLHEYGPMTQDELQVTTGLPDRTVRYALSRLHEETSLVQERPVLEDARKNEYRLKPTEAAHA